MTKSGHSTSEEVMEMVPQTATPGETRTAFVLMLMGPKDKWKSLTNFMGKVVIKAKISRTCEYGHGKQIYRAVFIKD